MYNSKKILIIDDDDLIQRVISDKLKNAGYITLQAQDGLKGLTLALYHTPAAIVLDILMPKMDGLTMLKELRKDQWGKQAQVIVLTNLSADDKIITQVLDTNPAYYFVKTNLALDDLIEKIKEVTKA